MTAILSRFRAGSASRPASARIEIVTAEALAAGDRDWDALSERAADPHPHFSRHVVEAHRAHGLAPHDLGLVTVRHGDRLDAVLPFTRGLDITGFGRAVAKPFLSPFVTSTAPLVAEGPEFAETMLLLTEGLAQASGGRAWRWPLLSTQARVGAALLAAMRAEGWSFAEIESFERPVLERRPDHDAFLDGHPHKNRLKDLRRRRRRLEETGRLTIETAREGGALAEAVEAFLALEAAGWKGEAGTALRSRPRTEAFARSLFAATGGPIGIRADTLALDGRPLAISLALIAGRNAALLKTAYDEGERQAAPGLLLEAEIVRALHETAFADRLDSATLPGSALESLYREREIVAEIIAVPPGGDGLVSLERRVRLARFEHAAKAEAKRLLRRG